MYDAQPPQPLDELYDKNTGKWVNSSPKECRHTFCIAEEEGKHHMCQQFENWKSECEKINKNAVDNFPGMMRTFSTYKKEEAEADTGSHTRNKNLVYQT